MNTTEFSDVQLINLRMLIIMRDCIKNDAAMACCIFGLHAHEAEPLGNLSINQIIDIVTNVGQECLFLPRKDLVALLDTPLSLTGPIMSVHPPQSAGSRAARVSHATSLA